MVITTIATVRNLCLVFIALCLSPSLLAQQGGTSNGWPPGSSSGTGASNVTSTTVTGPTSTVTIDSTSTPALSTLALTSANIGSALIQCFSGTGATKTAVAYNSYTYTAATPIATMTVTLGSSVSNVYCSVNSNGGAGATGATGATGAAGTPGNTQPVNLQTGTTYTFLNSDASKLVSQSNSASIADTLPQAGSGGNFAAAWYVDVANRGAGTITITPTTSTIDGASSLQLTTNQGVRIASDGTNYYTQRGIGGGGLGLAPFQVLTASGSTFTVPWDGVHSAFSMAISSSVGSPTVALPTPTGNAVGPIMLKFINSDGGSYTISYSGGAAQSALSTTIISGTSGGETLVTAAWGGSADPKWTPPSGAASTACGANVVSSVISIQSNGCPGAATATNIDKPRQCQPITGTTAQSCTMTGYTPAIGDTIDFLSFGNAASLSLTINSVSYAVHANGSATLSFTGGQTYTLSYDGTFWNLNSGGNSSTSIAETGKICRNQGGSSANSVLCTASGFSWASGEFLMVAIETNTTTPGTFTGTMTPSGSMTCEQNTSGTTGAALAFCWALLTQTTTAVTIASTTGAYTTVFMQSFTGGTGTTSGSPALASGSYQLSELFTPVSAGGFLMCIGYGSGQTYSNYSGNWAASVASGNSMSVSWGVNKTVCGLSHASNNIDIYGQMFK